MPTLCALVLVLALVGCRGAASGPTPTTTRVPAPTATAVPTYGATVELGPNAPWVRTATAGAVTATVTPTATGPATNAPIRAR